MPILSLPSHPIFQGVRSHIRIDFGLSPLTIGARRTMLYKYLARKRSTAAKRVENGERQSSALGITREGRVVCFNSTRTTKLDL